MPVNESLKSEILRLYSDDCNLVSRTHDGLMGREFHPEVLKLRRRNADRIHEIIKKSGFPGKSLVGEEASTAAAKIIIYSNQKPAIQRAAVETLIQAEKAGELTTPASPFLIDKIRFFEGSPQIFGTYLDWDSRGNLAPVTISDSLDVDSRRKAAGLQPLADFLESERKRALREGREGTYYTAARNRRLIEFFHGAGWRKSHKHRGQKQSIRHQFTGIGSVTVELHRHSAELHHYIKSQGEVTRLRRFTQLGLIDLVHQGAHHSKWDFIVLVMYLVDVAKKHSFNLHLGSNVRIGAETISKSELLKVWILLLGTGHLPWTFSAERELLWVIKNNAALREDFLGKFDTPPIRSLVKSVIRNEDPYRFHHAIAFYRLDLWRRPNTSPQFSTFLADALRSYLQPGKDDVVFRQLVDAFRLIRQIAYFILDLHHIPFLLEFDFRDILVNPDKFVRFVDAESHDAKKMLDQIQTFLNEYLYLDQKVSAMQETPMRKLRAAVIGDRALGIAHILKGLLDGEYQRHIDTGTKSYSLTLRLPFRPPVELLAKRLIIHPLTEERKIRRLLGGGRFDLRVWPLPSGAHKNVDFFFPTGFNDAQKIRIEARFAIGVLRYLIQQKALIEAHIEPSIRRDQLKVHRYSTSGAVARFIEHVLRHTMLYPGRLRFRPYRDFEIPMAVACDSRKEALRLISSSIAALGKSRLTKGRRDELRALRDSVQRSSGKYYAIMIGNLFIVDEEGERIGEIDGLFISSFYNKLRITIIEAKDQKRRGEKAISEQLENLIHSKLLLKDSLVPKFLQPVAMSGTARYGSVQIELIAPKNIRDVFPPTRKPTPSK